eukprot:3224844-Rhodomonas_salina.12
MVLYICYATSRADIGYLPTRQLGDVRLPISLCAVRYCPRSYYALSTYAATRYHRQWRETAQARFLVSSAKCLHARYAMPGADIAYGAICLRACYVMPGTDLASALPAYATCGTDVVSSVLPECEDVTY